MRIVRLADLFESKYDLKSEAATPREIYSDIKRELTDAYNNYINQRTAVKAYNIVPLLGNAGEINCRRIISLMKDVHENINDKTPSTLLREVNSVLAVISELQEDNHKKVRNSIRQHWIDVNRRVPTDNEMGMALSKWEQVVNKKLASILSKEAEKLKKISRSDETIMGRPTEPMVREPTKQEQFMFRQTPLASHHHVDDGDMFFKIWDNPELKPNLIRLINKSRYRHAPLETDHKIMREVLSILKAQRSKVTNENLFNVPEEEAKRQLSVLPPEEVWNRQMQEAKRLKQEEPDPEDLLNRDDAHRRRLEQERLKQIEEDRERLVKSEGSSRLEKILKRYQ
jgi:hypothetical protein